MASSNSGGDLNALKRTILLSIQTDPTEISMLSSKEKRRLRRSAEQLEKRTTFEGRGMDLLPFYSKTDSQDDLWSSLVKNTVTVAVGPAGVGKTLVALWWGLTAIKQDLIQKIIYVRSDVGCAHQRGRGALPGTLDEKMAPLVGPVMDNLSVICRSHGAGEYLMNKGIIQTMMLEDVRGRSFNESLIIFDEAQNSTPDQCKTTLSRVGEDSKIIITGDTKQIDLDVFRSNNGLLDCYHRLSNLGSVGRVQFSKSDIVRNGVIADILAAYDD